MEREPSLEEQVVQMLKEREWTLTTAESCTGGLLAGRILNVPGASEVYNEGHITYSNEAKHRLLGVKEETLNRFGAVSPQTAAEMAKGAAKAACAQVGLATTGIAGPGGGTPEKPVGLIYTGCYVDGQIGVKEWRLEGTRSDNRERTVEEILKQVRDALLHLKG